MGCPPSSGGTIFWFLGPQVLSPLLANTQRAVLLLQALLPQQVGLGYLDMEKTWTAVKKIQRRPTRKLRQWVRDRESNSVWIAWQTSQKHDQYLEVWRVKGQGGNTEDCVSGYETKCSQLKYNGCSPALPSVFMLNLKTIFAKDKMAHWENTKGFWGRVVSVPAPSWPNHEGTCHHLNDKQPAMSLQQLSEGPWLWRHTDFISPTSVAPTLSTESLHQQISMSSEALVMCFTSIDLFVSLSAFLACYIGAFQTIGKNNLFPSYITGGNSCVSKKGLHQNYWQGPCKVVHSTGGCCEGSVIWRYFSSCWLKGDDVPSDCPMLDVKGEDTFLLKYGMEPGCHLTWKHTAWSLTSCSKRWVSCHLPGPFFGGSPDNPKASCWLHAALWIPSLKWI